ncbi:MAG: hypothetical protein IJG38_00110 [Thermoguttaceae bacterium]|nr:hypothetical protein [Thermoguttaceae bacterium]
MYLKDITGKEHAIILEARWRPYPNDHVLRTIDSSYEVDSEFEFEGAVTKDGVMEGEETMTYETDKDKPIPYSFGCWTWEALVEDMENYLHKADIELFKGTLEYKWFYIETTEGAYFVIIPNEWF